MIKQCKTCGNTCWHNPMKRKEKEEQRYRCTSCGDPITTNVEMKKQQQERVRQRAIARKFLV